MSRESGDTIHATTVAMRSGPVGASPYTCRRPRVASLDPLRLRPRHGCRATSGAALAAGQHVGGRQDLIDALHQGRLGRSSRAAAGRASPLDRVPFMARSTRRECGGSSASYASVQGGRSFGVHSVCRPARGSSRSCSPMSGPIHAPQQNHLLAALSAAERERLYPHLRLVPMSLGNVLYESGDLLRHVYFPTDSIVSLLYVLADGASAEISVVGNDGLIGIALFMGGETPPSRAIVQSAGYAYRLIGQRLKDEL